MAPTDTLSLTVLVVDDYAGTRQMMRRTLEAYNYQVVEAGDGELALKAVRWWRAIGHSRRGVSQAVEIWR
jgi:CheY-like chemotaxis protein